ncbi:aerobic respiration control sensor protein ArcB, partial [Vibrio cholerae HC-78A1]
SDKKRP